MTEKQQTFDELVKECIEMELDGIVRGEPLAKRVKLICLMVVQWAAEKRSAK